MPELGAIGLAAAREQAGRGVREGQVRGVGSYGIFRGFSPASSGGGGGGAGRIGGIGKENVLPGSSWSSRRRRRSRRSPLPTWYPRTPLRDITVIIDVLERRRNRLREETAQRRTPDIGRSSSEDTSPDGFFLRELVAAEDISPSPSIVFETVVPSEKASTLPDESIASPSPSTCKPLNCADEAAMAESVKKLTSSLVEIEKRLKNRPKNTAQNSKAAWKRSTLMSMR